MENSYQNSVIAQILEAIIDSGTYDGATNSEIADILLSILNEEPYTKEPNSVIAELFLKVKAKIEGESYEPYDKPYISRIAEILISILNESEYNDAPSSRIAELLLELKEELESYTELTSSGAVCSFNTNVAKPLVSLKAGFKATQEAGTPTPSEPKAINGVSSVKVTRCGKNLYNYDVNRIKRGTTTSQTQRAYYDLGLSSGTFSFSGYFKSGVTPHTRRINLGRLANGQLSAIYEFIANGEVTPRTITYSASEKAVLILTLDDTEVLKSALQDMDIQAEVGSTATTYEQYNGESITIALGSTYYGGYIQKDNSGSKLVLTYEHADLSDFTWNSTADGYSQSPIIPNMKKSAGGAIKPNLFSEKLLVDTPANVYNKVTDNTISISIVGANSGLRVYMTSLAGYTGAQVKTALTGYKIAYELETPIELPLTDIPDITTFVGDNNIFNDSENTEVTYLYKGEPPINALSLGAGFGLGSSLSPNEDVEPAVEPELSDDSEEV